MAKRVVLLTGGTGLIGQEISEILTRNGFRVHILTREPDQETPDNIQHFHWDIKKQTIDADCFQDVNFAIHLAGAPIAKRWTESYKKTIINSRVETANFLYQKMKEHNVKLISYVGASASGYYVPNTGNLLYETSPAGYGFLAKVCKQWEEAHLQFKDIAKRVVINRIGIVLANNGGALKKMLPPFSFNIAPYFGDGQQAYPCIHVTDVANQFVYSVINRDLDGVYNACTEIVTQKTLNDKIAKALGKKPISIKVPHFMMQLMMGNMRYLLTDSYKMSGERIKNEGFSAQFGTIDEALDDLLGEQEEPDEQAEENNERDVSEANAG